MTSRASEHAPVENRRLEASDRIQRDFTHSRAAVAEHVAEYRTFGQAEALRIGADHPSHIQSAGWLNSVVQFPTQVSEVESTHVRSARPAMVPPGATVVLPERQPTQSPASESNHNRNSAQPAPNSLGGGPRDSRDSIAQPFSFTAVSENDAGHCPPGGHQSRPPPSPLSNVYLPSPASASRREVLAVGDGSLSQAESPWDNDQKGTNT